MKTSNRIGFLATKRQKESFSRLSLRGAYRRANIRSREKMEGRADSLSPPSRGRGNSRMRSTQSAYVESNYSVMITPTAGPACFAKASQAADGPALPQSTLTVFFAPFRFQRLIRRDNHLL